MTAPVVDKEEVAEQQGDAGFEDGFNEARGITPEPEKSPPVETAEPVVDKPVEEPPAADAAPVTPPAEEEGVTLSPAEVKTLLARLDDVDRLKSGQDKAFGTIGSMKTMLEKLQTAQATGEAPEITDEDMAELEDFPEFKDRFKKTLQKVLSKTRVAGVSVAPEIDTKPLEEKFQKQMEEQSVRYESKLLSIMHNDWQDVVKTEPFQLWLNTQPEDYRTQVSTSWDAMVVGGAITKFKSHVNAAAESATATSATKQTKTRRLEAAVTPAGVPAPDTTALNENDAFEAGFKSVRR